MAAAYLRWIPLLPLLGAAVLGLGGAWVQRRHGERAVAAIACLPVALAFAIAVRTFAALAAMPAEQRVLVDRLWTWIEIGSLHVDVAFLADPLSALMVLVVTGIGGLIHVYSVGYMRGEPAYWRFFALLNLFTAMMLVLVLADNLLLLFVGWEGVGLCSYALIGFWYADLANARAGSKAFLVNRVGDFAFALGLFLLFWTLEAHAEATLAFREIDRHAAALAGVSLGGWSVLTVITALLFVGATGKSAQIPLYVWLPDAMAGPTPVSALIHAATMVTAGVYLVARLDVLFALAPATLAAIAWVGAATALLAAAIAVVQNDIKKVLAYSTISQLGYMVLALGVGASGAAVFHLMTHAFFKACLFLGAGSVILALHHEQDLRRMGGLRAAMPRTYATFLVSALAIAGVPPLAGFVSKDEILWSALSHGDGGLWLVGWSVAGLTAFYMFRLVFLAFHGEARSEHAAPREAPAVMTVPLTILAAGAVFAGFLGWPEVLGGGNRLGAWLAPAAAHGGAHASHALAWELFSMVASIAMAAAGIAVAYAMYVRGLVAPERIAAWAGGAPYRWLARKLYVDEVYQALFVDGVLGASRVAARADARVIDAAVDGVAAGVRGWSRFQGAVDAIVVDGFVNRVADVALAAGGRLRRLQSGRINAYLYVIVAALVAVLAWQLG